MDSLLELCAASFLAKRIPSCEQLQYTAVLELRAGGDVLDALRVRFGVQSLTQQADTWRQNGRRLFLFGYGDDAVYPDTISPPANKSFYLQRMRTSKSLGFNFVRVRILNLGI